MIVVGMISGTSVDGIEGAVVEINGTAPELKWRLLKHVHVPYAQELRGEILACYRPDTGTVDRLCALNFAIGEAFAGAALEAIQTAGLEPSQVDLIGSHGQSVWHIPSGPRASTLQLGEPAVIAERSGITTVSNFRTRDMAAGGQGAPLVPLLDVLLLTHPTLTRAAQNIGGIGNVTFLPPAGVTTFKPFAFDTGPGNVVMDYCARRATDGAWTFDRDGTLAARGRVDETLLAELLSEPYLSQTPPKTTGPELFGAQYGAPLWDRARARGLTAEDIVATVTALTAHSIARAYRDFLPTRPDEVIVSGGGALNPVLMRMLRELLAPARVLTSDEAGLPAEAKEAIAFAVLAYETWHGQAGNVPAATGARHPVVLGNITPALTRAASNSRALTEARNPASEALDTLATLDMVRVMNAEDARVALAVSTELTQIAQAIDAIAARMQSGGRLVYIGAGTSGRLGVLDASEIPPTFSASPDTVVAVIAGGERAITHSTEGAEDDAPAGAGAIAALNVAPADAVVGIAASGRTPFVLGGMGEARRRGALVVSIACNHPSPMEEQADIRIAPLVGPEVLTGSTRLKSGTAQKMVLNMISTGVMIRLGKTYGNLMVDVHASNVKLRERARRIVESAGGLSAAEAERILSQTNGEVKTAIVASLTHLSPEEARARLSAARGSVRAALGSTRDEFLSDWNWTAVDAVVAEYLGKTFPAAQIEVLVAGRVAYARASGWLDPDTEAHPADVGTRFDLASVSKLFTVAAFMTYVKRGALEIDQPVREVLPNLTVRAPISPYPDPLHPGTLIAVTANDEAAPVNAGQVTFRHLLAHNSGLPAWLPLYQMDSREKMRETALKTAFAYPTGARVVYSDIGLILVGLALERIAGEPLAQIIAERVTRPLGLSSVRYGPLACENVAPTEFYPRLGRRMCGEVHDENAWGLQGVAGHAGLFGTAHDVASLGECYRRGGAPLLKQETVAEMTRLHAQDGAVRRGIGFVLWSPDPEASGNPFSQQAFGHTGFTGTSLWVDPGRELVVAAMTNRVYYGRDNADAMLAFRVRLHRAICEIPELRRDV